LGAPVTYTDHFAHADDVVSHLNTLVPGLPDPLLRAKYAGFAAVAAVTVYELAIKDVFIDFSRKKHKVFGEFTQVYFSRLNGRIKLRMLKEDHVRRFGSRYEKRFKRLLETENKTFLRTHRRELSSAYNNLIVWRHDFAHQGIISSSATYGEVVQAYEDGKKVIHCLASTMVR